MKYTMLTIAVLLLFSCHLPDKGKHTVSISTLQNVKIVLGREDSLQISKLKEENKIFAEKCKISNSDCLLDGGYLNAEFAGGMSTLRKLLTEHFKLPPNASKSKNYVKLIIGRENKIQSYLIESPDERIKQEIERVLKLPEFNRWNSASFNRYKLPYSLEFNVIIR